MLEGNNETDGYIITSGIIVVVRGAVFPDESILWHQLIEIMLRWVLWGRWWWFWSKTDIIASRLWMFKGEVRNQTSDDAYAAGN